jgi:hypothetical protein
VIAAGSFSQISSAGCWKENNALGGRASIAVEFVSCEEGAVVRGVITAGSFSQISSAGCWKENNSLDEVVADCFTLSWVECWLE